MTRRSSSAKKLTRPYDDRARWQKCRRRVLERDLICQLQISKDCTGDRLLTMDKGQTNTVVGGHIVDWATNGGAWFDLDNLRAECKKCSSAESLSRNREHGWKHAKTRITLVMSPPHGGASEWAAKKSKARDLIVDFEAICRNLGSTGPEHSDITKQAAGDQYSALMAKVRRGSTGARRVFIVSNNPNADKMFPHTDTKILTPDRGEVLELAGAVGRGRVKLCRDWYSERTAADGDEWDW